VLTIGLPRFLKDSLCVNILEVWLCLKLFQTALQLPYFLYDVDVVSLLPLFE